MTAEEKAKELVDKFYKADRDLLLNVDCTGAMDELIAKECALTCVDEILNNDREHLQLYSGDKVFWQSVKKAIEIL